MVKVDGPAAMAWRAKAPEQERPQLVHQRPDRMRAAGVGQLLVPGPEPGQHRVPDPGGQPPPVGVAGEQGGDVGEGDLAGAGRDGLQEGEAGGAEDVVGAGSPELAEDAAEDAGDVVGDHVVVGAGPVALQHVQARRRRLVSGVEQHHLPRHVGGEAGEQVGDRVAFGVDEHHPAARLGVGEDLAGDQGGLPGAGGADDPQMMAGVSDGDADRAGHPGVADPQRPDTGAGHRDGGRRGDGAGPGAGTGRAPTRRRAGGRSRPARGPTAGPPRRNRRAAIWAAGWRRWRRASQFRPAYRAVAEAMPCARPRSRARACACGCLVPQPAPRGRDGGGGGGVADLGVPLRARRLDDRGPHLSGQPRVGRGRAPPRGPAGAAGGQDVQQQPGALRAGRPMSGAGRDGRCAAAGRRGGPGGAGRR